MSSSIGSSRPRPDTPKPDSSRLRDVHVVPADQDHDASTACWCQPSNDYEDAVSGGRVWLHRRAHDLPHREPA